MRQNSTKRECGIGEKKYFIQYRYCNNNTKTQLTLQTNVGSAHGTAKQSDGTLTKQEKQLCKQTCSRNNNKNVKRQRKTETSKQSKKERKTTRQYRYTVIQVQSPILRWRCGGRSTWRSLLFLKIRVKLWAKFPNCLLQFASYEIYEVGNFLTQDSE